MRLFHIACVLLLLIAPLACDEHVEEVYADFQECFDDHTGGEGLAVEEAIVVCALDHPELGVPDFVDNAECEAYLDAELDAASATDQEIIDACDEYFIQRDM